MNNKKTLRSQYELKRSLFVTEHQKKDWSLIQQKLNENISRVLQELPKGLILTYQSLRTEPDMSQVVQEHSRHRWAYPKIVNDTLEFYEVQGGDQFAKGPLGFMEPVADESTKVDFQDVQAVVMPGVAFDLNGQRIGRGGGHYDRVLPLMPQALRVGVGFSCQLSFQALPFEAHDQRMHFIVTEELIWCPHWENWLKREQLEMKG